MDQPAIEYPCTWTYKIIGQDDVLLRDAVTSCVPNREYTLTASKSSSGGKYLSFRLDVRVNDESERNAVFTCLKGNPAVKYVL